MSTVIFQGNSKFLFSQTYPLAALGDVRDYEITAMKARETV